MQKKGRKRDNNDDDNEEEEDGEEKADNKVEVENKDIYICLYNNITTMPMWLVPCHHDIFHVQWVELSTNCTYKMLANRATNYWNIYNIQNGIN